MENKNNESIENTENSTENIESTEYTESVETTENTENTENTEPAKGGHDLGTGSIGKLMLKMAIPTIIAQIINMLYNVVDRMYIGHIPDVGGIALTGVGVTFPIIVIITAFSALVGMGGAPRAAISMGQGDNKTAEKIMGNCLTTLVIIAVILTVLTLIFAEPFILMFGGNRDTTLSYGMSYIRIYALGTIFVQCVMGMNVFITTQGFSTKAMLTIVIGAVINIILDPIFIFGFNMGVSGAAIATVISQAVSAVWVIKFLSGKKSVLKIRKSCLGFDKKIMLPVLALGLSPFIMQFTESILTVSFNFSLAQYGGDIAVGAMTILATAMQFAMMPLQGLTQGAQPIISYNYGAGNKKRVEKAFGLLLLFSFIFSLLFWSVCMFAPQFLVGMFSNDPNLVMFAEWALRIYIASVCIFGIQIACQHTFIALNQAGVSIFLALLRKIVLLIPLIFILPNIITPGFAGIFTPDNIPPLLESGGNIVKVFAVFLAEPISDFLAVVFTALMFALKFKKILSGNERCEKV